jgi:6-phosphogluconolactonase
MSYELRVYEDLEALSHAAAVLFIEACSKAVSEWGQFSVGLSGGETPKRTYELLAGEPYAAQVDWAKVHVLWSDERFVPPTDERSNERMAREALLGHVPIPEANIHPMWTGQGIEEAAKGYESVLDDLGRIDLMLLGMGNDAHTASLFPGNDLVNERILRVAPVHVPDGVDRITLTSPVLNGSREVVFLIGGESKREPLHQVLHGPLNPLKYPSQVVIREGRAILLVDKSAT